MTHSNQWLQERADLLATVTEWRERAEAAEAKVARLMKAGGALIDFHNLPLQAKHPDIYQRLLKRFLNAMENTDD